MLFRPSTAQVNYSTFASESDLIDGGVLAGIEIGCMDGFDDLGTPIFTFFNESTGDLALFDASQAPGERTTIIRSSAQVDVDLGGDVTGCRAITIHDGSIYAVLSVDENDSVYKTDLAGSFGSVLGEADGTTGIGLFVDGLLYLSGVQTLGAPADGFYTMSPNGTGQTPIPVATHPDLDLYDLEIREEESRILSSSSKMGEGEFQNVLVDYSPSSGSIAVYRDLFSAGVFTHGGDGGLRDIAGTYGCLCGDGHFVLNNSFSAPQGEQIGIAGLHVNWRVAEEGPTLADPDVTIPNYVAPQGTHMVIANGFLYVASTSAKGGGDAIIKMVNVPLPVELQSFEAVTEGVNVRLHWVTSSETNNAGFEVQEKQGIGWNVLGFVEGHGTSTATHAYSFMAGNREAGSHTFRLKQIDFDGGFAYSDEVEVFVDVSSTHHISPAYPNPFNSRTEFVLAVSTTQEVLIELFSALGQRVGVLADGVLEANQSQVVGIDAAALPSGVYVVRVSGERFRDVFWVTRLK